MKAWERERRLLERLQEQGSLALTEACALTGASVATTRRDFELLQEKGTFARLWHAQPELENYGKEGNA